MTAPTLPCAAPGCGLPPQHWIHYVGEGMALNGHFHRPTLSEPRPDDEGRELRARALSLANMIRGALLDADPVRGNATLAKIPALTPHPAPLGATDEGLRDLLASELRGAELFVGRFDASPLARDRANSLADRIEAMVRGTR